MKIRIHIIWLIGLVCMITGLHAQEHVAPLGFNGALIKSKPVKSASSLHKTTALTIPFFEDFAGYTQTNYPDNSVWVESEVYVNNTMGVNPVSRGVATFDGLNVSGIPYEPSISISLVYADSLTSKPFDLSTHTPADSIYFSFFYQPQGNGFYPETQDSLMLFFKKSNGAWVKVWSKEGTTLDSFKQVMVPVADTVYMFDTFQFRFVNKASMNTNDDVWNIDYIQFAAGRNMNDTVIDDVAFTIDPSFMLNDLTYMPYRQFIANTNSERATQHTTTIRNGYGNAQTVNYSYTAREVSTNTPLFAGSANNVSIPANSSTQVYFSTYTNTIPSTNLYDNFTFENKYIIESVSANDKKVNDTIIRNQVFHNFLAYDDGTAEKSYYLHLFPTLPGKLAIEYHLNRPDTIKGISIYFGRQVPLAYTKYFSVAVYKSISTSGGGDVKLYQEDFLIPAYQRNDFEWTYKFSSPVPMDAGTFYIGTIQPALSNSDSLYLGLDVNRTLANHLYYNVVGYWQPSTISGALMIRPILGQIIASGVNDRLVQNSIVGVSPNPATDNVQVHFDGKGKNQYDLYDVQGRLMDTGEVYSNDWINLQSLPNGIYFLKLYGGDKVYQPQKLIKQ